MGHPEPWLRGPIPGIQPLLQPVAHALTGVREDLLPLVRAMREDDLWKAAGASAPIGYHLAHMTGSLDRLLAYARGESLTQAQWDEYAIEQKVTEVRPSLRSLVDSLATALDRAIRDLQNVPHDRLLEAREVGRARLLSNVLGLLVHAAEHTVRHAGQISTLSHVLQEKKP